MKSYSGLLIAFEGIDGCGKSSLAHNVYYKLKDLQKNAVLTKEPGGTPFGEHLYTSCINNSDYVLTPEAEFLLFAAARAEHYAKVIKPALYNDSIVLSDRMGDSSVVYQGYVRGLSIDMINTINNWTTHTTKPDLTIYLQITLATALERIEQRNKKTHTFEKEAFLQKAINGFDALYQQRNDILILDGTENPQTLLQTSITRILQL